ALTEGALRAMFLAKMKMGFAVLLALGLVGAGAGGWAYRSSPAAQAREKSSEKQKPAQRVQADEEKQAKRAAEREDQIKRADAEWRSIEKTLEEFEARTGTERADLRIRLLEMEERLNAMRGQHRTQQEVEFAALGTAKSKIEPLQQQLS